MCDTSYFRRVGDSPIPGAGAYADSEVRKDRYEQIKKKITIVSIKLSSIGIFVPEPSTTANQGGVLLKLDTNIPTADFCSLHTVITV